MVGLEHICYHVSLNYSLSIDIFPVHQCASISHDLMESVIGLR